MQSFGAYRIIQNFVFLGNLMYKTSTDETAQQAP